MNNEIILSISLLASNRRETVIRCLDSLKPLREQIPSELIIVDTGCNQELRKSLDGYADHIVDFVWCNDFSKARNVGLELARGEWFFYIDDDEWFVDVEKLVAFFKNGDYKNFGYANYIQRNFQDREGKQYSDSWVMRMVRKTKETHFESKIHEYLWPLKGNCAAIEAIVHHYGYVFDTREEEIAHYERNCILLLDMIKEEPDNLRWRVQLLQEYRSMQKYEELYDCSMECLQLTSNISGTYENIYLGTFYYGAILGLMGKEKYKEALEMCKRAEADQRNTELCRANICLFGGECCFHLENWEKSKQYCEQYFQWEEKLREQEGLLFMQKMSLLVSEIFDEVNLKKGYSILICSALKMKDIFPLKKFLPNLEWDRESIYVPPWILPTLIEAMEELDYDTVFVDVLQLIHRHEILWNAFCKNLEIEKTQNIKGYDIVMQIVSQINDAEEEILYFKVKNAENLEEMEAYFQVYIKHILVYCRQYFKSEILEQYTELLPDNCQAALCMQKAFEQSNADYKTALQYMKKAAVTEPRLAGSIQTYAKAYGQAVEESTQKRKEELQQLTRQLKEKVIDFQNEGNYKEAMEILDELIKLLPKDLEVVEMRLNNRVKMLE